MDTVNINKCRYEIQEQKRDFRYGIPTYTGAFRTLLETE
jgi:hypothetical protein